MLQAMVEALLFLLQPDFWVDLNVMSPWLPYLSSGPFATEAQAPVCLGNAKRSQRCDLHVQGRVLNWRY